MKKFIHLLIAGLTFAACFALIGCQKPCPITHSYAFHEERGYPLTLGTNFDQYYTVREDHAQGTICAIELPNGQDDIVLDRGSAIPPCPVVGK
jgi:hypothetical protein